MSRVDFERWRQRVVLGLAVAAALIVAFWVAWWCDRRLVASRTTEAYYGFEQGFQLADAWLLIAVATAGVTLWRRRPSALVWLAAAGGAGLYLLGMDMYYDLGHGIYSRASGVIELVIDILVAGASAGVLWWSWRARRQLLGDPASDEFVRVSAS